MKYDNVDLYGTSPIVALKRVLGTLSRADLQAEPSAQDSTQQLERLGVAHAAGEAVVLLGHVGHRAAVHIDGVGVCQRRRGRRRGLGAAVLRGAERGCAGRSGGVRRSVRHRPPTGYLKAGSTYN